MKKIYLSFLILFPAYANAVLLPVGKPTENGHQTYWSTDEKKYVHRWDMVERDKYISRSAASGHIEAGGKKSVNSVGGTVKQSVSKKTVFANLYKNAKSGGKYIGRVAGIFGWWNTPQRIQAVFVDFAYFSAIFTNNFNIIIYPLGNLFFYNKHRRLDALLPNFKFFQIIFITIFIFCYFICYSRYTNRFYYYI